MENDHQIIELCLQGRSSGFSRLLAEYQARVYRRAYSFVHQREDALDITQEVFLKVIRSIHTFVPGRPLWPWLRRITTNVALNFIRRKSPQQSLDDPGETTEVAGGADPADEAMAAWDWDQLLSALDHLPALYRVAVVLRHQEELSYEEIARTMDLPLGTVKTYLFRARRLLRLELATYREGSS